MLNANDQTFDDIVKNSDKPVLVDFWAEWCGPCRMLGPVFEEVSGILGDKVTFVKVNVDEAGSTATAYNISSIPALVLFKNGEVKAMTLGYHRTDALTKWVESNI